MELAYHPLFANWMSQLKVENEEVAGEVTALLTALKEHGLALGDPESHPVVTSRLCLRALRRTPPTSVTPDADDPPVLRVLYGFATANTGETRAVILYAGDKTELGSAWYPPAVAEAERRLTIFCGQKSWKIRQFRAEI